MALASNIPQPVLARRKVQLEPAQCTPRQVQVQRFLLVAIVLHLVFTPSYVSVKRLNSQHLRLPQTCNKPITCDTELIFTAVATAHKRRRTRVTLLPVLHWLHRFQLEDTCGHFSSDKLAVSLKCLRCCCCCCSCCCCCCCTCVLRQVQYEVQSVLTALSSLSVCLSSLPFLPFCLFG